MLWSEIEETEKTGIHRESNSGHHASALPLSYDKQTTTSPHNPLFVLHRWCWNVWVTLPGSPLSMCHRTSLGVDRKILSIRREPMLSSFLTRNAWIILPHARNRNTFISDFQRWLWSKMIQTHHILLQEESGHAHLHVFHFLPLNLCGQLAIAIIALLQWNPLLKDTHEIRTPG